MGYKKKYLAQYAYLDDCMQPDDMEGATIEERLQYLIDTFEHFSTDWKKKCFPAHIDRMADMLAGLPSACSVDYETYRIFEVGQEWGYISKDITTEDLNEILGHKDASDFINGWYKFLAKRIDEMVDYYGLRYQSYFNYF